MSRRSRRKGPDRREVWRQAAERVGGRYVPGEKAARDQVLLRHGPWVIVLDTFVVNAGNTYTTYVRARAFFRSRTALNLRIRKRNVFDGLLTALGFGGFVPGNRELARKYVVRGRPEARLPSVVTGELATRILAQPWFRLEVGRAPRKYRKRWGDDVRQVAAVSSRGMDDVDRVVGLMEVVRETLDTLRRVGAAAERPVLEEI